MSHDLRGESVVSNFFMSPDDDDAIENFAAPSSDCSVFAELSDGVFRTESLEFWDDDFLLSLELASEDFEEEEEEAEKDCGEEDLWEEDCSSSFELPSTVSGELGKFWMT